MTLKHGVSGEYDACSSSIDSMASKELTDALERLRKEYEEPESVSPYAHQCLNEFKREWPSIDKAIESVLSAHKSSVLV